jgi:putative ABC transport system permease protein
MIARMANVGHISEDEWDEMNRRNKRLEWDDLEWLKSQCTKCTEVGAQVNTSQDLKHEGEETFGTQIAGVTANMAEIEDKTIAEGRFLAPHETERASYACVIGWDIREKFYPGVDPVGRTLKIRDVPFQIVGVEAKRGSMFGQSMDNHAYIPITTFGKLFGRRQSLQLHGKAPSRIELYSTIEQARVALRNKHKLRGNEKDDFGLVDVEQANNQVDQFTGAIKGVVTPITFISLLVGGIVVMNIMLVSVTERTFEIGLRKAVGARRNQIMMQFLIESSLLSSFGGMFGLMLASGVSWLITATTPVPMNITFFYALLSLIVSGSIGMIFGIYPAFKAARLDPIVALTKK